MLANKVETWHGSVSVLTIVVAHVHVYFDGLSPTFVEYIVDVH